MTNTTICCIRRSEAIRCASLYLSDRGLCVSSYPTRSTGHLILPVPSFSNGCGYLEELLPTLSKDVIIYGGNLDIPLLRDYRTVDFLKDPFYLADNAAITARCTIEILEKNLELSGCPVLILGWGRIGKCLGRLLRDLGADVTIAARKDADLAMLHALGYGSVPVTAAAEGIERFQVILNTVPAMILPEFYPREDALILELASTPGMSGNHIMSALGLPSKMAPEESGRLIAETFMRLSLL